MDEAKQRVEKELEELNEKLVKLTAFVYSSKFLQLSREMRYLMMDQLRSMQEYASCLVKRLDIWGMTDQELSKASPCTLVKGE